MTWRRPGARRLVLVPCRLRPVAARQRPGQPHRARPPPADRCGPSRPTLVAGPRDRGRPEVRRVPADHIPLPDPASPPSGPVGTAGTAGAPLPNGTEVGHGGDEGGQVGLPAMEGGRLGVGLLQVEQVAQQALEPAGVDLNACGSRERRRAATGSLAGPPAGRPARAGHLHIQHARRRREQPSRPPRDLIPGTVFSPDRPPRGRPCRPPAGRPGP